MRAKLELKTEKNTLIPFNHQYHLASMIYGMLNTGNSEYAKKLHEYDKYKFFTFSWLDIPNRTFSNGGLISNDGRLFLKLSSPNDEFLFNFVQGLFEKEELTVGNIKMKPSEIIVEKIPSSFNALKTISPVYVKTQVEQDGKKSVKDLVPNNSKFYENLKTNLKNKYESYYGKKCDLDFQIEILDYKTKRMNIKNTFHVCSNMKFEISGDYNLIKFGYECGFGEKNSMGFGMVENFYK
ncbi:CRISPR-associated endoribonuclease Cas6 [Methanococcus sp. CF]